MNNRSTFTIILIIFCFTNLKGKPLEDESLEELQFLYSQYSILFHQFLNAILTNPDASDAMKECALKVNDQATQLDNQTSIDYLDCQNYVDPEPCEISVLSKAVPILYEYLSALSHCE